MVDVKAAGRPDGEVSDQPTMDLVGSRVKLLFVGVNPSTGSQAVGAPFAHKSNRFWKALYLAGILDRVVSVTPRFSSEDRAHVLARGVGITSLVRRPTGRAAELSADELIEGVSGLSGRVRAIRPRVVAILGITAFRIAFQQPSAKAGLQAFSFAGCDLAVVPNPSGRNAHASIEHIASAYRAVAIQAGIEPLTASIDDSSSESSVTINGLSR